MYDYVSYYLLNYLRMKELALGIDIGGTNTVFGLVDEKGNIFFQNSFKTKNYSNPNDLAKVIYDKWLEIKPKLKENEKLKGVGIGAPNGNYFTGCVEFAPNLNWNKKVPLKSIFEKYFKVPVYLNNDANAATIGEMMFGAAKKYKDFIFITIGTGLGSGFVSNGKLIYGYKGLAGEFGHTLHIPNGRLCGCGKKGCLEAYVSANGIKNTAIEILKNSKIKSLLRNFSNSELTPKLIYKAALKKDKLAIRVFNITGEILGTKLADAVLITNPQAIILFGGISNAGKLLIKPIKNAMENNLLPVFKNCVKIIQSKLLDKNAAVLGAAAMVWQK